MLKTCRFSRHKALQLPYKLSHRPDTLQRLRGDNHPPKLLFQLVQLLCNHNHPRSAPDRFHPPANVNQAAATIFTCFLVFAHSLSLAMPARMSAAL